MRYPTQDLFPSFDIDWATIQVCARRWTDTGSNADFEGRVLSIPATRIELKGDFVAVDSTPSLYGGRNGEPKISKPAGENRFFRSFFVIFV